MTARPKTPFYLPSAPLRVPHAPNRAGWSHYQGGVLPSVQRANEAAGLPSGITDEAYAAMAHFAASKHQRMAQRLGVPVAPAPAPAPAPPADPAPETLRVGSLAEARHLGFVEVAGAPGLLRRAEGEAAQKRLVVENLGDILGSLRYMGQCADCRSQFMSRSDRAASLPGGGTVCAGCADKRNKALDGEGKQGSRRTASVGARQAHSIWEMRGRGDGSFDIVRKHDERDLEFRTASAGAFGARSAMRHTASDDETFGPPDPRTGAADATEFARRRGLPHVEVLRDFGKRYTTITLKLGGVLIGEKTEHLTRGKVTSTVYYLPEVPDLYNKYDDPDYDGSGEHTARLAALAREIVGSRVVAARGGGLHPGTVVELDPERHLAHVFFDHGSTHTVPIADLSPTGATRRQAAGGGEIDLSEVDDDLRRAGDLLWLPEFSALRAAWESPSRMAPREAVERAVDALSALLNYGHDQGLTPAEEEEEIRPLWQALTAVLGSARDAHVRPQQLVAASGVAARGPFA